VVGGEVVHKREETRVVVAEEGAVAATEVAVVVATEAVEEL
jgi:hypothetical protein